MLKRIAQNRLQRGDTIVEVMVVLAVLGLAIGISFATANKSLLSTRDSQEHSEATALLQGQVEGLRALAAVTTPDIFNQPAPGYFCVNDISDDVVTTSLTTPASGCLKNALYNVSVVFTPASHTFKLTATWDSVVDNAKDTVVLNYRLQR